MSHTYREYTLSLFANIRYFFQSQKGFGEILPHLQSNRMLYI